MAVKEGKWKCEFCGAVNLGRDMNCGSCQAVRGKNVKFFLDDDAAEVEDESLKTLASGGADWHCGFCGTDNRAHETVCSQCNAPREGMKNRETGFMDSEPETTPPPEPPKKKRLPLVIAALAGIAALVIGGTILVKSLTSAKSTFTYTGAQWVRTVVVEEQQWKTKTTWEDKVPSGGEYLDSWEEERSREKIQVGTEKVKTGTKDMGNGFFEDVYEERAVYEDRPVMDTKVKYRILEWEESRKVSKEGTLDDPLQWPDPRLQVQEREGRKSQRFTLNFEGDYDEESPGKEPAFYTTEKEKDLKKFTVGESYNASVKKGSGEITRFLKD